MTNNVTSFDSFLFGFPVDSFDAEAEAFAYTDGVDASPGGTSNISAALGGGGASNPVIVAFIAALNQDDYSFIPVISSLAIDNEDDWFAAPDIGGVHSSPFVNTYIPSENESHVMVTSESAQFALDEIRNGGLGFSEVILQKKYQLIENPVKQHILLQLDPSFDYGELNISAITVSGKQLFSETYNRPTDRIAIAQQLDSGIYFLTIQDQTGVYSLKFVVQ